MVTHPGIAQILLLTGGSRFSCQDAEQCPFVQGIAKRNPYQHADRGWVSSPIDSCLTHALNLDAQAGRPKIQSRKIEID